MRERSCAQNPVGGFALAKARTIDYVAEKSRRVGHAEKREFVEREDHPAARVLASFAGRNDLGEQPIVIGRIAVPGVRYVSTRTPGPAGRLRCSTRPVAGRKSCARLRRRSGTRSLLRAARRLAHALSGRNPQLLGNEVASEAQLGHRMLDLQASIDFKEVKLFASTRNSTVPAL